VDGDCGDELLLAVVTLEGIPFDTALLLLLLLLIWDDPGEGAEDRKGITRE
jgi:hypothetical protein